MLRMVSQQHPCPYQDHMSSAGPAGLDRENVPKRKGVPSSVLPAPSGFEGVQASLALQPPAFVEPPMAAYTTSLLSTTVTQSMWQPLNTLALTAWLANWRTITFKSLGQWLGLANVGEFGSPVGWIYDVDRHRYGPIPNVRYLARLPKMELPRYDGDPMMFVKLFFVQVDRVYVESCSASSRICRCTQTVTSSA